MSVGRRAALLATAAAMVALLPACWHWPSPDAVTRSPSKPSRPAASPATPSGSRYRIEGSEFVDVGGGKWEERAPNGSVKYRFACRQKTPAYVELHDARRDLYVRLYASYAVARAGSSGDWRPWPGSQHGQWVGRRVGPPTYKPVPGWSPPCFASSLSALRNEGALGFPQRSAQVLCDTPNIRVSAANDGQYLYVQAVLCKDGDAGLGPPVPAKVTCDSSIVLLDLDGDGQPTPNTDRHYSLNPTPSSSGLRYQVTLGPRATTTLRNDSKGKGSIRYAKTGKGSLVRVDSYLIPLAEISKREGDTIRLCYWGYSPKPDMTVSSLPSDRNGQYAFPYLIPLSQYQEVRLKSGGKLNADAVPDGRNDPVSGMRQIATDSPTQGVAPRLLSPPNGAVLDNGRRKHGRVVWDFDWADCPGAECYHLCVMHSGSVYPVINETALRTSSYQSAKPGYISEHNRLEWMWKVRARFRTGWGPWSGPRSFSVEPADPSHTRAMGRPQPTRVSPNVSAGQVAPDFTAKALDGATFALSRQRGKAVLLDFWATWCGPCRQEAPNVVKVWEEFRDQGLVVVGISLDRDDDRGSAAGKVRDFTAQEGMGWAQIVQGGAWQTPVAQLYGVHAIPHTVLIDRDGKVIAVDVRGPTLRPAVEQALRKNR